MSKTSSAEVEDLKQQVRHLSLQLDAARRMAASVSTSTNTDDIVREALQISLELAEADAGSVLLYDADHKSLVFKYVIGEAADKLMGTRIPADSGLAGSVFLTGKTRVSHDVSKEQAHDGKVDARTGYHTQSMVTVSMKTPAGESLGVMQVLNKKQGQFDDQDVSLIEIMANQSAISIETSRLYERARLAAIMAFIGDISHDVKNMVTPSITGAQTLQMISEDVFAQLDAVMKKRDACAAEVAEAVRDLRDAYPEMIGMILDGAEMVQERMAEISAAVKGMISTPAFVSTDMVMLVKRVQTVLGLVAEKKGVRLSVGVPEEGIMAEVDPKQMYNAIYNLAQNAIDACSEGDSVTLFLHVEKSEGKSLLVLECIDTGPGMPEHIRKRAFTNDAVSTKPMGTGLGTKIVKNVIDSHGGAIEVISEMGRGTTVRCTLPLARS